MKRNGKPTVREIELGRARVAGYHNDSHLYTVAVIERRTASEKTLHAAWVEGVRARVAGKPCSCRDCTKAQA